MTLEIGSERFGPYSPWEITSSRTYAGYGYNYDNGVHSIDTIWVESGPEGHSRPIFCPDPDTLLLVLEAPQSCAYI